MERIERLERMVVEAYITERGYMLLEKYELYRERVEAAAQDIYKDVFQDGELF